MGKGQETKNQILGSAFKMASRLGLDGLSIGTLAKETGMSKSGLFAHFQSKENLQLELLSHAGRDFAESVVVPALAEKAGIPRIRAVAANWRALTAKMTGGCIFVTAATEYNDRPGPVRDFLIAQQNEWLDSLRRLALAAVRVGDFREDSDPDQFAYEFYSLLLGFHMYRTLLKTEDVEERQQRALDRLLASYG